MEAIPEAFGPEATHYCRYRDVCAWAIPLISQQENTWDITQLLTEAINLVAKDPNPSDNLAAPDQNQNNLVVPDPPVIIEVMSDTQSESTSESALEVVSDTKSGSTSESEDCMITSEEMSEDGDDSDEDDSDEDDLNVVLETTRGNVTFSTS